MNDIISKCLFTIILYLTMLFPVNVIAAGENGITLAQSIAIVQAAQLLAEKKGILLNIAVVDSGANLTSFVRMDGAYLGSIDLAIKKAKTARYFNMPTGKLGELSRPGQPLHDIEISNGGLVTFPGGAPIMDKNGNIIGAIGVSGGSVEDDNEVAIAGTKVILQ